MSKKLKQRTKYIQELKKYTTLGGGISYYKNHISIEELSTFYDEIFKVTYYKNTLTGNLFPDKIENLGNSRLLSSSGSLEKELYWTALTISRHSQKINDFLILKRKFNTNILHGDLDSAWGILDLIENKFGFSIWLLENRISLMEEKDGLKKQKTFVNDIIRDNSVVRSLVKFLVSYHSIRAEKNISPSKYDSRIDELNEEIKENSNESEEFSLYNYIEFKLNLSTIKKYDFDKILIYENLFSLIDRYHTFIKICEYQTVKSESFNFNSLKKLLLHIEDPVLKSILNVIQKTNYFEDLKTNAMNYFISGEYQETINICEELLNSYPDNVEIYHIYVSSLIREKQDSIFIGKTCLLGQIIFLLENLYIHNSKSSESYTKLLKITYLYASQDWAWKLRGLIISVHYDFNTAYNNDFVHIGELLSNNFNPIFNLYNREIPTLFNTENENDSLNKSLQLYEAIHEKDLIKLTMLHLPSEQFKKFKAKILFSLDDFDAASLLFNEIVKSEHFLDRLDGILGLVTCHIKNGKLMDCINIIAEFMLLNENIFMKLPIVNILDEIENNTDNSIFKNLSIPIIYDVYSKNISSDRDSLKADAYEEFLYSQNLLKPSDLKLIKNNFIESELIYYLRNVCVPTVMDNSIEFENTEEIETERILVCQLLREIDSNNEKYYLEEIKNITQRQMIRKGLQEIEKSKIYVDVEGIKATHEKSLKEGFIRYKSFLQQKFKDEVPEFIYINSPEGDRVLLQIKMPRNEKTNLLTSMVIELRDSFVSSNEYGLDVYLSVGIRHGTLSGQLRGPIEAENLITQYDSENERYYTNHFWKQKFNYTNQENSEKINNYLEEFSMNIDELIDMLKNSWIQIKTENKNPERMFNFIITFEDIKYVEDIVSENTTYEEFVETVFDLLWKKTDSSLERIRSHISSELKDKFNNTFELLQQNINTLKPVVDVTDINSDIARTKTTIQYELDKISNWFTRSKIAERSNYQLNLPIEIGFEMIKNIYTNKTIKVENKFLENVTLNGKTLKSFVDIAFIIFDNIIKHSNMENAPEVEITFKREDEKLILTCINEMNTQFDITEGNAKLQKYRSKLKEANALEMVSKEGGTGFSKIKKIIQIDLKCEHNINFEYIKDKGFLISIEIDAKEIIE